MSRLRNPLFLVVLTFLSLSSCTDGEPEDMGFAVSLAGSGETILSDRHVAAYLWDKHRIVLTPSGIERWESFVKLDESQDPAVRKLDGLTGKEFVMTIAGVEMYRGHFWSMASSLMKPGVLLYDTVGAMSGELWIGFERLNGDPGADPRGRPEIRAYFRKKGKLREAA